MTIVVTNAPYGGIALWRASSSGRIERVEFPWAKLSVIDSLVVSPDGKDVAYVEGGSAYGPLLVRHLEDGGNTVVAAHVAGRERVVLAWSPDGRKVIYADRSAGASSYFVFDRDDPKPVKIDIPGELSAWLPSGNLIVVDDDGALTRVERGGTKKPVAVGPYRHNAFFLDMAGGRLLSTAWDDSSKRDAILALDLATWTESPVAPPAPYATYLHPSASPSGRRLAWLATSRVGRSLAEELVVDEKTLVAPTYDLVGYAWIGEDVLVAHFRDRLDVLDVKDGKVKGSQITHAEDSMR